MTSRSSGRAGLLFHADALDAVPRVSNAARSTSSTSTPLQRAAAPFARAHAARRSARTAHQRERPRTPTSDAWGGRASLLSMLRPRLAALRESDEAAGVVVAPPRLPHRCITPRSCATRSSARAHFAARSCGCPGNGARGRGPSVTHQTLLIFSRDAEPSARASLECGRPRPARAVCRHQLADALSGTEHADGRALPRAHHRRQDVPLLRATRGASSAACGATSRE